MFYTKKEKRKLKTELKKELRNEIEEIINNYTEFNNTSRTSYNNLYDMHAENNQELFEAIQKMYDKIIRLENDVKKLSRSYSSEGYAGYTSTITKDGIMFFTGVTPAVIKTLNKNGLSMVIIV